MRGVDKATWLRLGASAVLLGACPLLRCVFSRYGRAFFPAYRTACKMLISIQATVASIAGVALWDLVALALVIGALVKLATHIRDKKPLLPWLSAVVLVCAAIYFPFGGIWALNHYAPPLATEIGLEVHQYSVDELAAATNSFLNRAAKLASCVPREEDGSLKHQDFFELARIAGSSYATLEEDYPVLAGPHVPVKALLVWGPPLLYSGHTGIYWAATGEAGVPLDCAVADTPFIMCHEAAHRLAIASEQEANFCSFLACDASGDVRLEYSGYYSAFSYCFNALYRYAPERAQQLLEDAAAGELHDGLVLLWNDRLATHAHYDAYEGPFEDVGTAVNDTYLKSYGEQEGVRSYGLVVDYLIAWNQTPANSGK